MVQSYEASGKESVESEKNRFTIIPKGKQTEAIDLELDPFIQHGHVIEVTGKTQIGARVMVNGREVPMVSTDGTFHYFTPPLTTGRSGDYGDGADGAGRSEYAAEEDHYSVEPSAGKSARLRMTRAEVGFRPRVRGTFGPGRVAEPLID